MSGRMYDWLLTGPPKGPKDLRDSLEGLHGRLLGSRLIVADNVAEQYFRDNLVAPDIDGVSLAPPFPSFFVEMTASQNPTLRHEVPFAESWHIGGLFEDVTDRPLSEEIAAVEPAAELLRQSRWCVSITIFHKKRGRDFEHVGGLMFGLDDHGLLETGSLLAAVTEEKYSVGIEDEVFTISQEGHMLGLTQDGKLLLRAVAFMHCRNVHQEQRVPNPKVSRTFRKKHGTPLASYYVLRVGHRCYRVRRLRRNRG